MGDKFERKMRLGLFFLGALSQVNGQESVCPTSWAEGKHKCFKFIGQRMKLAQAGKKCKDMGGQIFAPSDETEIRQLQEVARKKSFGLKWPVHQIWIAFKIADTSSKVYPPKVVPVKAGETPFWLSNTKITTSLWESNVKTMVRFGRNQRMKMKNIKMKKGKWSLTKPGIRTFGAAAVCEMKKPKQVVGDPQVCWQPQSDIFDRVEYSGIYQRQILGSNVQIGMTNLSIHTNLNPSVPTTFVEILETKQWVPGVTLISLEQLKRINGIIAQFRCARSLKMSLSELKQLVADVQLSMPLCQELSTDDQPSLVSLLIKFVSDITKNFRSAVK